MSVETSSTSSGGSATTEADVCGNGIQEEGEFCDGDDLPFVKCKDYDSDKYSGGDLSCAISCKYNFTDCVQIECEGSILACGDCIDNDDDGLVDLADPECVSPCDDLEDTFATGLPGDNMDACNQDCFFDGNSGSGDDKCSWDLACDPANPGGDKCPYDPDAKCPEMQDEECLMYKVPSKGIVQTIPTAKFNLETSRLPGFIALNVWDIGGQNIESWSSHCVDVDGLIFVVDSADHARIQQAGKQFMSILNLDEMRHVPVVAIANKQDLPTARKPEAVADQLGLKSLEERKWAVQGAMQGVGLEEALEKISTFLKYY